MHRFQCPDMIYGIDLRKTPHYNTPHHTVLVHLPLAHLPWLKKAHLPLGFWHFCPQKLHICPGRKWHIRSRYFYLHFVHATKICNMFNIHMILFEIFLLFIYFCIVMLVYMYFLFEYLNWHSFILRTTSYFFKCYTLLALIWSGILKFLYFLLWYPGLP